MTLWILTLAMAYLLGSIPFGYLLVRFFRHEDIRATGSGNIGATNVARSGAKILAALTLLLDVAKGLIAVRIAMHLMPGAPGYPSHLAIAAAIVAVIGHVYPVWLGFSGGKGVASALGVFLAFAPWAGLASLTIFILLTVLTRYVSLASIIAAAMIPVFTMMTVPDRDPIFISGIMFIALLVILKHHANIARLLNGTELRMGAKKKPLDEKVV
jgi:glycerol-3-phosphate acyltransferase PlsY